jgi:hypothetical protein
MRASALPACDDIIRHVVHQFTRELRNSGITSPGINFQQFLQYVAANPDAFEQLYQTASLSLWSRRMAAPANEPQPGVPGTAGDITWTPALHVSAWVSGSREGRRPEVAEVVELVPGRNDPRWLQSWQAVLNLDSKALWLARCSRLVVQTLHAIASRAPLPALLSLDMDAEAEAVVQTRADAARLLPADLQGDCGASKKSKDSTKVVAPRSDTVFAVGDRVQLAEGYRDHSDARDGPLSPGDVGTIIRAPAPPGVSNVCVCVYVCVCVCVCVCVSV